MPREDTQTPPARAKKALPACDSCKHRRVRCDPVPPPASCSRCITKGIRPRVRTGKRIEEAKEMHGTSQSVASPSPVVRAEDAMVDLEITGDLVSHLLLRRVQVYTHTPRAQFFPCFSMMAAFESVGRRLTTLPPRSQTLALAIAATAARISSHPVLLGSGPMPPALSSFFFNPMSIAEDSTYDFGKRRENACEKLRQLALEQAWKSNVLEADGQEALETCYLLYALENRDPTRSKTTNIWATAFVSVLRLAVGSRQIHTFDPETGTYKLPYCPSAPPVRQVSLDQLDPPIHQLSLQASRVEDMNVTVKANSSPDTSSKSPLPLEVIQQELFWYEDYPGPSGMAIRWAINIMQEALASAAYGKICPYTLQDEVMLAGPPPPTPQEILTEEEALEDFQWWDTQNFWAVVRPYTYQITQMALNSFDWSSRQRSGRPFSMTRLREHMSALKPLHAILSLAYTRFTVAFGSEATAMRINAHQPEAIDRHTASRVANRREFSDRQNACLVLGAMTHAMAHVNIPIWTDVEIRLRSWSGKGDVSDAAKWELEQVMVGLRRALLPYACRTLGEDWQGAGGRTSISWLTLRCKLSSQPRDSMLTGL
ncbi:hypothetical protein CONPUDRAFT_77111 [Coniophora puteana RWD-64-598 SS2]|uniref:Zn(2)-C6 fungal-type domain-containing protein n=1 Tax=Coniophora puteana (strain RWD-64-598) TaxID=741705 RepID=A0A5M3M808_CONPW|nr:uncharacterized protein CONPUDRAFT_77111 [Coniophora puteana RWD-64-598 SS2]EIW75412.1 hypothetical protein CONPUDRAFT_77111 [Coniophora puteana RWD-64-598 SS2]